MTAIDCMETDTGVAVRLERDALRSVRSRADAKSLLQDMWDLMPRSDDDANQENLANVRLHIRSGELKAARFAFIESSFDHADILNVRGVVSELEGDFRSAEQVYKAALIWDPLCSAAKFNLQRCYELWTFGRSDIPICL